MAKKKNSVSKYTSLLAILLAIASACMIFCTAIVYKVSDSANPVNFTGMQVTFGYTANALEGITSSIKADINYFAFSFMNLLPYILLLVGKGPEKTMIENGISEYIDERKEVKKWLPK